MDPFISKGFSYTPGQARLALMLHFNSNIYYIPSDDFKSYSITQSFKWDE